jgi:hypothetical protein
MHDMRKDTCLHVWSLNTMNYELTQDHARYPLFDFYPWQTSNFLLFLCEGCTVKFSYRYVVHEEPQLVNKMKN